MTVTERFEIPPEMRAFAEKSVEQARQAFDGFISAAHRAVSTFEGRPRAPARAPRMSPRRRSFSPRTTSPPRSSSRKSWCRRRNVEDVLKLQADYIKTQMQVLTEQAKELGESTSKAARDTTKSRH